MTRALQDQEFVNLGEMYLMDGGTLNQVTGDNPEIFGVDSSRRDIGRYPDVADAGRWSSWVVLV